MKRGLLNIFIFTCLTFYTKNSLAVRIDSIFIFSKYYNTDSSEVFLDVKAFVSSSPCSIASISTADTSGFVQVNFCYDGGSATTICRMRDTVSLGIRHNGTINVLAIFKENYFSQCSSSNVYKDSFELVINTDPTNLFDPAIPSTHFHLSPNPTSSHVTITIDETLLNSTATITDVTGRKMAAVQLATTNQQLETSRFESGVYFVTITNSEGKSATKKLVVSR